MDNTVLSSSFELVLLDDLMSYNSLGNWSVLRYCLWLARTSQKMLVALCVELAQCRKLLIRIISKKYSSSKKTSTTRLSCAMSAKLWPPRKCTDELVLRRGVEFKFKSWVPIKLSSSLLSQKNSLSYSFWNHTQISNVQAWDICSEKFWRNVTNIPGSCQCLGLPEDWADDGSKPQLCEWEPLREAADREKWKWAQEKWAPETSPCCH